MIPHPPIYIGDEALEKLVAFCKQNELEKFMLVTDQNTYRVLGAKVEQQLREQGWDVKNAMIEGENIDSDERSFMQVFLKSDQSERTYIAIGSGTITDVTRFTSKVTRNQFICMPTAASVDAYNPINAALTINGIKSSVQCHTPLAVFCDLNTVATAPKRLTSSGFGDLVSKLAAPIDWRLNALLGDVQFDQEIFKRVLAAAKRMVDVREGIANSDRESMRIFMECQIESGLCMADYGNSTPVSGAEHQMEHMWGMYWYHQNRHGLMHGDAVGVAVVITSSWFEQLRRISREEASRRLNELKIPSRQEQEIVLHEKLGVFADYVIKGNPIIMQLTDPVKFQQLQEKILNNWDEIQASAEQVPSPQQFTAWMKTAGAPTLPAEIGLSNAEVELAKDYSHYFRNRFSIAVLRQLLGIT